MTRRSVRGASPSIDSPSPHDDTVRTCRPLRVAPDSLAARVECVSPEGVDDAQKVITRARGRKDGRMRERVSALHSSGGCRVVFPAPASPLMDFADAPLSNTSPSPSRCPAPAPPSCMLPTPWHRHRRRPHFSARQVADRLPHTRFLTMTLFGWGVVRLGI